MSNKLLKKIFPGVSWHNPVLRFIFTLIDPIDYWVRVNHNLGYLPKYSIRVRSNGVYRQFGGKSFVFYGELLANILKENIGFDRPILILEIGCGCGRVAFGLSNFDTISYTGVDIDRISFEESRSNPVLKQLGYRFELMDVFNREYNPSGNFKANSYTFPYPDHNFDVIFLVSVFTHMLSSDVERYIQEISRMLKPGGTCMFSTFLMDFGRSFERSELSFIYNENSSYYCSQKVPEKSVGYYLDFFQEKFKENGMVLSKLIIGGWRKSREIKSNSGFPQDILFFKKES